MEVDFMASVPNEGSYESTDGESNESVNDNIEAPPTETNDNETKPPQGGEADGAKEESASSNTSDESPVPFHKHPRWQEMQREREELKETTAKLQAELESFKSLNKPKEEVKLPESWVIRYGDSEDSKNAYIKYRSEELPSLKQEIMQEIKAEQEKAKAQETNFIKWVEGEVQKVADKHDVDFKKDESLKNEFLAFMNKRRPTDDKGNIDFINGWEWFSEIKQASNPDAKKKQDERKKLASMTGAEGKAEGKKDEPISASKLRNLGWTDLY